MKMSDIIFVDSLRTRLSLSGSRGGDGVPPSPHQKTVLAVDISGSMIDNDFPPNRYRAAVEACRQFIDVRAHISRDDIIGAVLFNHSAQLVSKGCPVTSAGKSIIAPMLRRSPGGGTKIIEGLKQAAKILSHHTAGTRRIIVLSDGYGGRPIEFAQTLKNAGITIDTIGVAGSVQEVDEEGMKGIASISSETGKPRYRFIGDGNIEELFSYFRQLATDIVKV